MCCLVQVRTPLNGCLASAEMLLETPLAEEQRELAKTIRVSGSILLSTVSNFLDFFKLEAGECLLRLIPFVCINCDCLLCSAGSASAPASDVEHSGCN